MRIVDSPWIKNVGILDVYMISRC